ncbi:MAG: hypothetical protein JXB62_01475 [Pirellulales bacterium]|nr:hypothetical protein [Pirellulales bacterium]
MANALNVIHPYKWEGLWVFDDARVGLDKEPFVEGADAIIEKALAVKGIEEPEKGFRLLFSAGPFPNYDLKLRWLRESEGGNWYRAEEFAMEGWLCPALLKYFDEPPTEIYARLEAKGAHSDHPRTS